MNKLALLISRVNILRSNPSKLATDVAVGNYLYMAKLLFNLDWQEYPYVLDYLERLSQRKAFKDTVEQR